MRRGHEPTLPCLALAALLAVSAACRREPLPASAVVGAWELAADSRERLPAELRGVAGGLELAADGTFTATELPGDLLYVREPARLQPVSGGGRWQVETAGGSQEVRLTFERIHEGGERQVPFGTQLEVAGDGDRRRLWYFRGDPDDGPRIYFDRRPR